MGSGLLNKISVLWLGFGIFVGVIATPERRWLKTEYPYIAGVIAFALFLPFIIWNTTHGLAHLNCRNRQKNILPSRQRIFLSGQSVVQNPVTLPLWFAGLFWFLFSEESPLFRILAYIYLTALAVLLLGARPTP